MIRFQAHLLLFLAMTASTAWSAPVRVLVVTGGHDFDPAFWELFESDEGIVLERGEQPGALQELSPDRARLHDTVVFYDLHTRPLSETARRNFLALLEAGTGVVVLHHALASHPDWPAYRRAIGGRYWLRERRDAGGEKIAASTYRHDVDLRVEIADPAHPIVRGIADFDLHDEVYGGLEIDPDVHQLLRTSQSDSSAVIGWCRRAKASRVVVLQPGHGPRAYRHPSYRELVRRSIRWAARRLDTRDALSIDSVLSRPWQRLTAGDALDGWRRHGQARWTVRDGVLSGVPGPAGVAGSLIGEERFENFELTVTFRVRGRCRAGVWFRHASPEKSYRAEIVTAGEPSGSTVAVRRGGGDLLARSDEPTTLRDGWNTLRIRTRDAQFAIDLNGIRVAEASDDLAGKGCVGFHIDGAAASSSEDARLDILDARIRTLDGVSDDDLLLLEAPQRIERYRRGPLRVRVVDAEGEPVAGARVTVRQTQHEFLFGCNIFMHGRFDDPESEKLYRDRFAGLFNFATLPFYWRSYERAKGEPQHASREAVARWCREQGIETKGHPLVWNHPASVPDWLPDDPKQVRSLSQGRTVDCVTRFRGLVDRWDVVNEAVDPWRFDGDNPMTEAMRVAGVVDWTLRSFLAARKANPSATLLINDYRTGPGYEKLIESLVHDGRRVYDAIGIQSHMHGGAWSATQVRRTCERFARFGVPLHFTETTIVSGPRGENRRWGRSTAERESRQEREVAQFYTMLYSHPGVEAITWWDLADRGAWQGAPAGLLRRNLTPKPAYEMLRDLVQDRWRTATTVVTDESGRACVRATFGRYAIAASRPPASGGKRHTHASSAGGPEVEIRLGSPDTTHPRKPPAPGS